MIYDCFSYWDEDLLLDLRLNILNKFVDYFVIVEGNKTWQNNPKKFRFDLNKFNKFKKKRLENNQYIPDKTKKKKIHKRYQLFINRLNKKIT